MAKTLRQAGKLDFVYPDAHQFTLDEVEVGVLQRIADASELMASNFLELQTSRDYYKRRALQAEELSNHLQRRISSFKGQITKLKNKANEDKRPDTADHKPDAKRTRTSH
jgi:hypothetical protein